MGTPEFAVASLEALVNAGCNIVGVITAPDKPAGRGMQLQQSAVKKFALKNSLTVFQPQKLKDENFLLQLAQLGADLQIVVAFRMLPEVVWSNPPIGTINVHGSLLPYYRGAAPINWAIINGEKETGITTFRLKHEIDTGNIILQQRISIYDDETAGELHDRMKEAGASLLLKTIEGLAAGELTEQPQSLFSKDQSTILKHAPKIFTETCHINWSKPINEVYNLIRGLSPYPAAFTEFAGKKLKIYKTRKEYDSKAMPAGSYETDNKSFLKFACNDGYIHLLELQMEGKKRMPVADFLRGFHF